MSVDTIDTRSLRKEAYTMLRTGQAIDKTLKWTMRTKLKTGPIAKVSITVDPPRSPVDIVHISTSAPGSPKNASRLSPTQSPIQTPGLERATFTQSGVSKAAHASIPVDAPTSILTLKGKIVPVDLVKDAMVDIFRKEGSVLRNSPPKERHTDSLLEITDEGSIDSRVRLFDSVSSIGAEQDKHPQFMRSTQAKQVAKLADPREEANLKWKRMKTLRDERNASLERRKGREALQQTFTRIALNAQQSEFNRAYRDQYLHREYTVQRQHQERMDERRRLDDNLNRRLETHRKQQQRESKYMRTMLRESASKARAALWEEVSLNKMNNELSGTVSRSQSCLDATSSSKVHIPDQLRNKLKTAKSLEAFEAARKQIKDYYQASMSDRIGQYARTREDAISRASATDTRLTLSPIRGADLFQDSVSSRELEDFEIQQFVQAHLAATSAKLKPTVVPKTPSDPTALKPMTPSPPRPSTSDFVLKEYFASKTLQEELFDLENFSLHSSEDVGGFQDIQLDRY